MKFRKFYIYSILIFILLINFRDNLNFNLGDRSAFTNIQNFQIDPNFKDFVAHRIFSYSKFVGEMIFCLIYYRNAFILSDLIYRISPLKEQINSRLLYLSILLGLFSPISIMFTSFAGKDIIAILLSSMFCIHFLKKIKECKIKLINIFYLIILFVLIFSLRELTGIFAGLLSFGLIIFYTNLINQKVFIFSLISFLTIVYINFSEIYLFLYPIFERQLIGTIVDNQITFTNINPLFKLNVYFENVYQGFTGINIIHFKDSFYKSIGIALNTFLNYMLGLAFNFKNWLYKSDLSFYFLLKLIFFILYFSIYAFLSQNNAGGAVRYFSSIIPLLLTFLFVVAPSKKITHLN